MKRQLALCAAAAATFAPSALAQAPATVSISANVASNTAFNATNPIPFTDPAFNAILPGSQLQLDFSVSVIPSTVTGSGGAANVATYAIDVAPATFSLGLITQTVNFESLSNNADITFSENGNVDQIFLRGLFANTPSDTGFGLLLRTDSMDPDMLQDASLLANGSIAYSPGAATDEERLWFLEDVGMGTNYAEIDFNNITVTVTVPAPISGAYCTASQVPNSTGELARLWVAGNFIASANDATVIVDRLPVGEFGMGLVSMSVGSSPLLNTAGTLCLGGAIGRLNRPGEIFQTTAAGTATISLDLTDMPQGNGSVSVVPGQTWNVQVWHRDGPTSAALTEAASMFFL